MSITAQPVIPGAGEGTFAIGDTPVVINGIKHIAHSGNKLNTEDVSDLSTVTRDAVFMATTRDNGSISIDGNYLATDAGQMAVAAAYGTASTTKFTVSYPKESGATTAATDTFSGIVTEWSVDLQFGKTSQFKAEIKISGPITSTATA